MKEAIDLYVEKLYQNQNFGMERTRTNLFSRSDYYNLLKPVEKILEDFGDASLEDQRSVLYRMSPVREKIEEFVNRKGIVPGLVASYGTPLYNETLVIGSRQEVGQDSNGRLVPNIELMQEDTIFDLASVTKVFTSISILKLVEDGTININDSITEYAPQFKNLSNVKISDLIAFQVPLKTSKRVDKASSREEAEEILFDIAVDKENNNLNPYTDMGAMVLKYVIEGASGLSYGDYLEKNVISKLGLNDTHIVVPDTKIDRVASTNFGVRLLEEKDSYTRDYSSPNGVVNDPKARILGQEEGNLSGHAGLFATVKDMATLGKALANGSILSRESIEELARNRTGKTVDGKIVQHLGYLVYVKNPNSDSSDVYHALSGNSFTSSGRTGTQITVDPINETHFAMAGGRTHNRLSFIPKERQEEVVTDKWGRRSILLPNGRNVTDSTRFPWEKDEIVHAMQALAIQYKILEDIQGASKQNIKPVAKTLRLV